MKTQKTLLALALMFVGGAAQAELSSEEIKSLNTTLTPWSAIKAGNSDGTIPAWDGGLPADTAPPGFKKDSGRWADPYGNEKPLYTITAKNMDQYADKLSEVTKVMLTRFPDTYQVNGYPTHRPVNYPKFVIYETFKHNGRCQTIENGLAIKGCKTSVPFRSTKTNS